MTAAPIFDPFGLVAKHGSHDQKSHGNWARGGHEVIVGEAVYDSGGIKHSTSPPSKYPTGYVVPGHPASGDFRAESEPARRFTEFWQRTYEGYGLVREAAMRVLDGKDPLGDRPNDSHSVFMMEEDGTWVNDADGYTYDDLYQDVESAGRWVADGLRNGSTGKVLFRGTNMTRDQIDRLAVSGETLGLGPSATSENLKVANRYSMNDLDPGEARVVFRFPESTKHLDLVPHSDWGTMHPEQIVAGKFKVTGVFENRRAVGNLYIQGNPDTEPHYYVNLEPVEQP